MYGHTYIYIQTYTFSNLYTPDSVLYANDVEAKLIDAGSHDVTISSSNAHVDQT